MTLTDFQIRPVHVEYIEPSTAIRILKDAVRLHLDEQIYLCHAVEEVDAYYDDRFYTKKIILSAIYPSTSLGGYLGTLFGISCIGIFDTVEQSKEARVMLANKIIDQLEKM